MKVFDIHMDATYFQIGAEINQNGKPIALYSRKLIPDQSRYTVTEKEFLSIVKTLLENGCFLYNSIISSVDLYLINMFQRKIVLLFKNIELRFS